MNDGMKSTLIEEIRARGHWTILIRPSRFVERRVNAHADLDGIVQAASVQLRGWDFPHISPHESRARGPGWIAQESSWNEFQEVWRAYFSGQFFDIDALTDDWRTENTFSPPPAGYAPGKSLSVYDVVFRFAEVFEFAARLATSPAGDDQMFVSVALNKMTGRELAMSPDRLPFRAPKVATVDTVPYEVELPRAELVARPRELAVEPTRRVFELFDWDAPTGIIQEIQANLWR